MKFGKHIQQHMLPEWSAHYMSYKGLKKLIKKAEQTNDSAESHAFFYALERELEKVNAFYLEKEAELKARLRLLQDKRQILSSKAAKTTEVLLNLQEAFMQFQHELIKLQNFVELNATGFRKILKKFDRRTKATTKEMYLASHVDVQPCFNKEVLADLADLASTQLSDLDSTVRDVSNHRITFEQWIQNADHLANDLINSLTTDDADQAKDLIAKIKLLQQDSGDHEWLQRALKKACAKGASRCVRLLIESGADVRAVDDVNGRSNLHLATMSGHYDIVVMLAETGKVDTSLEDMHGRRALHYAAMGGHDRIVKFLLEKKVADLTIDQDGSSPLVYAVTRGHTTCVAAFLEKGGDILHQETGKDPLALAAEFGHAEIVEMLIKKGFDVNKLTLSGIGPLHLSCREGHASCTELLTRYGADLLLFDKYNQWSPVFYAASEGHIECVKVLLESKKCKIDEVDEAGWTPWQHALHRGHIETAELLKLPTLTREIASASPKTKTTPQPISLEVNDSDIDMLDALPTLELPPPMIPCKIYGHNFLDKKIQIQIKLGTPNSLKKKKSLTLYDSRQSTSLKLNISAHPNGGIPHTVILPLEDEQEVFTFETVSLDSFTLYFDILPTFGSKVIGRAVALSSLFKSSSGSISLSVLDRFELVGEIWFEYVVIEPFSHPAMAFSGKVQTYWKTTSTVVAPRSEKKEKITTSMITASSLAKEYIMVSVQVTKDGIPVIYDKTALEGIDFDLAVGDITCEQFLRLPLPAWLQEIKVNKGAQFNELEEKKKVLQSGTPSLLHGIHITLQDLLKYSFPTVGICLDIAYQPHRSLSSNQYASAILQAIYDHAGTRSMILSSSDPVLCLMANLKQPNYPVFFRTYAGLKKLQDARCNSIDQGVRFAKGANLLGVVCEATPLVQVPPLITTIKSAGLVLATFGEANGVPANIVLQDRFNVDAVVHEGSIRVKSHVEWF